MPVYNNLQDEIEVYTYGMSQTVIMVLIQLLTLGLPYIGVTVGSDQLTGAVQTIVLVVTGIWIYVRRVSQPDVTLAGIRK